MKTRSRLGVAALCLLAAVSSAVAQGPAKLTSQVLQGMELRNIGPAFTPGRIADIAVDPKNDSVWYLATASSGLWKTTTRGISWAPVFDRGGSYSLGCVAVDPNNSNVVWLGSGENQS